VSQAKHLGAVVAAESISRIVAMVWTAKLLHDTVNRRGQDPQFGASLGLDTHPAVPPL